MKHRTILATAGLIALFTVGISSPTSAATDPPITPTVKGAETFVALAADPVRAKLVSLQGTQTSSEIAAILKSPDAAEALYDPITGRYLAAFTTGSRSAIDLFGLS